LKVFGRIDPEQNFVILVFPIKSASLEIQLYSDESAPFEIWLYSVEYSRVDSGKNLVLLG